MSAPADRVTDHWTGIAGVALLVGGVGIVAQRAGLLLVSVVGVVYAGYAAAARAPRVEGALEVRRALSESTPAPGEAVTVTVRVTNVGDGFLPDVRVVDCVPGELTVSDGSPRHATALRPGATATFSYEVTASRGDHEWRAARVVAADPSGSVERQTRVEAETGVRCRPRLLAVEDLPVRALTARYAGRVPTDSGGAGVEFHAVREYRAGDPKRRIDWNRLARTRELSTLEFRLERAATVVLLIDARKEAYRAPGSDAPHAVERSVDAVGRAFGALLDAGDRAGIYVFGPEEAWLPPDAGTDHRARGRAALADHETLSSVPPEERLYETFREDRRETLLRSRVERLRRRLPPDAQVFLFSPCCDGYMPRVARRLDAAGHLVTVFSPDPTTDDTPGHRLARMDREDRLAALRGEGLRVVDWARDDSFEAAVHRAESRWSR